MNPDVAQENGGPDTDNPQNAQVQAPAPEWQQQALLSLDGGGIRGYWTLKALETLVDHIAVVELGEDETTNFEPVDSSFAPVPMPPNVSHLPSGNVEDQYLRRRRFLLCHYFDFMIGSSTGALIALMLGRFRMTVPDCLHEYRTLGDAVFGHPRFITQQRLLIIQRHKYKAARLEQVIQDVTDRRAEELPIGEPLLPLTEGVCQVCITSLRLKKEHDQQAHPYMLRTYDGRQRQRYINPRTRANTGESGALNGGPPPRRPTRQRTQRDIASGDTLNYEEAQHLPIWKVARAATAARTYFKPIEIMIRGQQEGLSLFEDGGFGNLNNPSVEGKEEIQRILGHTSVALAVSVGTARMRESNADRSTRGLVRSLTASVTNVEVAHQKMMRASEQENFDYYRFNAEGNYALKFPLDEWEPRGTLNWMFRRGQSGTRTIQTMDEQFAKWVANVNVQQDFRDCARDLVTRRRNRSGPELTSRWETYSTATHFKCDLEGCQAYRRPIRRDTFRTHLERDHTEVPGFDYERLMSEYKKCWEYRPPPSPNRSMA